MSEDHPPDPVPIENRVPAQPPLPRRRPDPVEHRIHVEPMLRGAALGFIASWVLTAITLLVLYSTYGDSTLLNVLGYCALGFPAAVSLALLVPARTRYLGAGLLMGFAIGSILGAGVCVGSGVVSG